MWRELEELTAAHLPHSMVWEGEPADTTVKRLEAMGLGSVVYSPCASIPGEGDFLSVMLDNAAGLGRSLR